MARMTKARKRKFDFKPTHQDPDDLIAIPASVYGSFRQWSPDATRIYIHERHTEYGHSPGRLVATVYLDSDETKRIFKSIVQTQSKSVIDRLIESARRGR